MQYKFQIKNEEVQRFWHTGWEEEDTAENFRFGGEYREIEKGVHNI
jgi:hypothetical protein